ncbi:TRI11 [Colletotrichum higginsianum]|uniref:TRI11 n=1 Tax=Colletotrichum higginsianum (strain IMI 349063) TaxID=759273 RepID=H1VD30_COLHI|nr:TRI11 protein [Colletotrichum higginsianum IMI 349063]OBR14519.1 TRI11 protein [Colletotrichum higginsianum IMI 349063]CCF38133.1 TRI11 [Colletotrichum higginsianum]
MGLNLATLFFTAAAVYLLARLITLLLSPLNRFPGPWYAKFTGLPGTIATLSRRQAQYYHRLHETYGPFVRVSPNQIFVSDLEAFKKIHKVGSSFLKSDTYRFFAPAGPGEPPYGLFAMTDKEDHAQRRKLLARGFTTTSLRNDWEDIVRDKIADTIRGIQRDAAAEGGEVDIMKWWMLMTSDTISRLMFGESFDGLKTGEEDPWFGHLKSANTAVFSAMSFPTLYAMVKRLPVVGGLWIFHAHEPILDKGRIAVENSKNSSEANTSLFSKVMEQAGEDEKGLSDLEICVEAAAFMVGGTDTTSNTLTYLVWAVLSRDELRESLERELAAVEEPLTDASLEALPILTAVIEETLRLHGAAPTPLPRVVPDGGVELGGRFVPAGAVVATQAWTLHRDPTIFDDPETFDHTRWLPGGPVARSATAKAAFTPFGAGSRGCIGRHLAYMELRFGAAMFFRTFRGAKLAASTTPESMEMANLAVVEPEAKACRVVLPGF